MQKKLETLEKLLGRQPEVVRTKSNKYAVEYIDFTAKASDLLGDTEEEAVDKLLAFLSRKQYSEGQETQHDEIRVEPSRENDQET